MALSMLPSISWKAISIAAREWAGIGGVSLANIPLSDARLARWASMSCCLRDMLSATFMITDFLYTSSLSFDRFSATRTDLCTEFGIQANWWGQQPACTSKSGWITLGAHPKADKRASFQIAACRLGLAIMQAMPCDDIRYL